MWDGGFGKMGKGRSKQPQLHSLQYFILSSIASHLHSMEDVVHILGGQLLHAAERHRGSRGIRLASLRQPGVFLHLLEADPLLGVHHQHHADETGEEETTASNFVSKAKKNITPKFHY